MFGFARSLGSLFLDIVETIVIGLSLFLVVYLFLMQPHQVSGQSMYPNFHNGDYVLTDKVSYRLGEPKRGDVVVFHAPPAANCPTGTGCDFIKRVIALPGETVEIKNNHFYINGQLLQEDYIPNDMATNPGSFTRDRVVTMGIDEYFLVGDNRPYSSDSRGWGPVPIDEIVGRAFFRYWPLDEMGAIRSSDYAFGE